MPTVTRRGFLALLPPLGAAAAALPAAAQQASTPLTTGAPQDTGKLIAWAAKELDDIEGYLDGKFPGDPDRPWIKKRGAA